MKKKKIITFLALNIGLFSLCTMGCQKDSKAKQWSAKMKASEQTVKVNNQGDLASLHPHLGIDLQCRIFQKALFEGLTRINAKGEPALAMAKSVDISKNKTTYTFHLRPALWTNGQNVLAEHFVTAWRAALSPKSNCLRPDLFYPIKNARAAKQGLVSLDEIGIKSIDDKTLVVELEHPTPYFLDLLANPLFSPLYEVTQSPNVFNGPFEIESYDHSKYLHLKKNEKYWDAQHVKLQKIETSLVKDPNTAQIMYEKGELDWVGSPFTLLSLDSIENLSESHEYASKGISGVYWLCLNTEHFPLNNKKIRKALSYAINREEIAHHLLLGETPSRSVTPPTMQLLNEKELYPDGNLQEARALFDQGLQELGITRQEFPKLVFSHSDIGGQKQLTEAIHQIWEKAFDISIEIAGTEWNTFFGNLGNKKFQIGGCIWYSAFNDPIYSLEFFKDKSHRYNSCGWQNEKYKNLLDLADGEVDLDKRRDYLRQAELLLLDEMPIIPLYAYHYKYLKSPKLQGINLSDLGQVDFKEMYVDQAQLAKR